MAPAWARSKLREGMTEIMRSKLSGIYWRIGYNDGSGGLDSDTDILIATENVTSGWLMSEEEAIQLADGILEAVAMRRDAR